MQMELALNLAWILLAIAMVCQWLRQGWTDCRERRAQMVALCVLLLVLLPAISMTDDLIAAQNPAEIDSCVRRDHEHANPQALCSLAADLPQPLFAGAPAGRLSLAAPGFFPAPHVDPPALTSIESRPPPAI